MFNNHIEKNRNDFVNSYSSEIVFEMPFKDNKYMIFGSDVRIQEHGQDDDRQRTEYSGLYKQDGREGQSGLHNVS